LCAQHLPHFNSKPLATDTTAILNEAGEAISTITGLMAGVDDNKVNTVPFEGSWTAPQLMRHVSMSINGMTRALKTESKRADRDPAQRAEEFKKIFLDASNRFTQPEFLIPEDRVYEKQASTDELNDAFNNFKEAAKTAQQDQLVEGLPLGPSTKLELIYFVLYHTQRHLRQMQKICEALNEK
jgi:hypothetical protein